MNTSFAPAAPTTFAAALAEKATPKMCKLLEEKIEEASDAQLYESLDPPGAADGEKVVQRVLRALFFVRPSATSALGGGGGGGGGAAGRADSGAGAYGGGGGGAWPTEHHYSITERESLAAFNMLQPIKNPRVRPNSPECKGGVFWAKMKALSREAKRFNVRTEGLLPDLHTFAFCAQHEQVLLIQRHPFLNLFGKHRNGMLCLDTLEFYLFCLCYTLVETTAPAPPAGMYGGAHAAPPAFVGVTSFVKLLSSYLEHFFPRPASKRSGLALANPWSTPGAADAERAAAASRQSTGRPHENPGTTLIYLIAELWLHRYAPLRPIASAHTLGMPPQQLLQCVLCVVNHVCKSPFQTEAASGAGGALSRSLQGVGEMKEHVMALRRPVFEFLLHCFRHSSEQHAEELSLAVDVWIAWTTMGGTLVANNADHHRRGSRMGIMRFRSRDKRELEPSEQQWVAQNYVFLAVLPLWWVGAAAKLARMNPELGAKVVEKVVLSLLDNKSVEFVDELSQLLRDERTKDPKRMLVVQPPSQAYASAAETMEVTDQPVAKFVETYVDKSGAHREEHQSERRFRELMRSLRQTYQDEDHEAVTVRLRALLHIDPDAEQESDMQLTQWPLRKTPQGWGFSCDESGVITSADGDRLPLSSQIVRVTGMAANDRPSIPFQSRSDLREFLSQYDEALFEVREARTLLAARCDQGVSWLSEGAPWASVVPYSTVGSDHEPYSDLGDEFDRCGLGLAMRKLNAYSRQNPGCLFAGSVLLAATRAALGGQGVLALIVAGVLVPKCFALPAPITQWFPSQGDESAGGDAAVPVVARFKFDFSFMFKSEYSSPLASLAFNVVWVGIFGSFFAWVVTSETLDVVSLLGFCAPAHPRFPR